MLSPTSPALDGFEAKLASFELLSFDAVRVGLREGTGPIRWLVLPHSAANLRSMFTTRPRIVTKAGAAAWRALVTNP